MKISELPFKLKELAEWRRKQWKEHSTESHLSSAFAWDETPEGSRFWADICAGNIPEEYLEKNYEIY